MKWLSEVRIINMGHHKSCHYHSTITYMVELMLNYKFFQKLKLLKNNEFNDLNIILTPLSHVCLNSPLISGSNIWNF